MLKEKSYVMQITGDRLRLVNEQHGTQASVGIEDLKDSAGTAAGTRVTLHIPYCKVGSKTSLAMSML